MSKLNSLTCLVSAGYPVWYSYGVSRGVIDVSSGLRQELRQNAVSGNYPEWEKYEIQLTDYKYNNKAKPELTLREWWKKNKEKYFKTVNAQNVILSKLYKYMIKRLQDKTIKGRRKDLTNEILADIKARFGLSITNFNPQLDETNNDF